MTAALAVWAVAPWYTGAERWAPAKPPGWPRPPVPAAVEAAEGHIEAILTLDYRRADQDVAGIVARSTPEFRPAVQAWMTAIAHGYRTIQKVQRGEVVRLAVERSSPTMVTVVCFVNVFWTDRDHPAEVTAEQTGRMTVRLVDGRWLMAGSRDEGKVPEASAGEGRAN